MSKNDNLHKAKDAKNDEFYTRIEDVAEELRHYKKHFAGKVVLCNCDDPTWSAFWRYFHLNFAELGLKKLISTHYDRTEPTYKMEYEGGDDNNVEIGVKTPLEDNGDFRNKECLDLLDECDIVVTNGPFSLFREFVGTLMEYGKKFIIWGNNNAITYKEFFPLLKENMVWLGYTANKTCAFRVAEGYRFDEKLTAQYNDGFKYGKVPAISVFTNLDIQKRHEKLILWQRYYDDDGNPLPDAEERYPAFDELNNVINVNKVSDIPADYKGFMAVPITFLDKYNPDQFELIDALNRYTILDYFQINNSIQERHSHCCNIKGKATYDRDGLESGQMYMAVHQHDEDANDLWLYFQSVINWAKMLFPSKRKGITDAQTWGLLYNQYHSKQYNSNALEADIKKLVLDDDVTKKAGIIPFILSDRTWRDEKHLSLRAFTESQKLRAYERQGHKCPLCVANGINTEYAFEDMEGDHIVPWSKGGHTTDNNLQMLCKKCNAAKSDK